MGTLKTYAILLAAYSICTSSAISDTLTFENYNLLGSYSSDGLYNLAGLGTWNGQPLSDSNMPSDYERELATTMNFFASPTAPNILFIQVTDVTTTHFGYASGAAFINITQTGVQLTLPAGSNLGLPSLSLGYANPNQTLVYAPPNYSSQPLTTTPGFGLSQLGQNQFLIQTTSGTDYGFINDGWGVYGSANRIVGGGVFELTFAGNVNLFQQIDFSSADVESQYGAGNQYIAATAAPEPFSTWLFAVGGLFILAFRRGRERLARWT